MSSKRSLSLFLISILFLAILLVPNGVDGATLSDTVTIAGGDTYSVTFDAQSGDLDWEVFVYGDYFSGEYEHTGIYMEIYDNDEEENVYGLIDVEDNSDTVYLDSTGEYKFSLENENDFSVDVYYSLDYEELSLSLCCSGAMVGAVILLAAAVFLVSVLRRTRRS